MPDHVVKSGETLWGIAKSYGVTVQSVKDANPQIRNPKLMRPGELIRIPGRTSNPKKWVAMSFDGHKLHVRSASGTPKRSFRARSGLPAGHDRTQELISEGRKDLDLETDYRAPEHQETPDAGPIPTNDYKLRLTQQMDYEKSGGGWGEGGWWLDEGGWDRNFNPFSSDRSEFFLHHDGGTDGTGGCIGVKTSADLREIKKILLEAYRNGQREVQVDVEYPD